VYAKVPVAVPSVEPTVADTEIPIVGENSTAFAPAMTGPINVIVAVPAAPNDAPVAATPSGDATTLRPTMNGAVWPAPSPVPMQSAS
jgi:hypothetical protein